ncbi:MAG: TonB-dependent receptor [Dysgonamonadaceae bacterium]|jgi:TonB-linked SusC/RagA family outer membrane protein|nr:TonB-dependent receptor [Dysgonamonadaceae bacterium]
MKCRKVFLFLVIFLTVCFCGFSQNEISVSGIILDRQGEPITGASVLEKGTMRGTITDVDGKFLLNVSDKNAVLTFSYLGFKRQDVALNGKLSLSIRMEEDEHVLDEMVVVGYGVVKKKDLTGALSTLQGSAISERKTTTVSQALQGAIPGVMVTRNNSAPGAGADIRIRGITTIGDSRPLVIVDGAPADLDNINPNDIENMTVLKDAAAASIYGARAAAGVIVITTKRAKDNRFSLEYNFEYGLEIPTKQPEYADARGYMQTVNEIRWNDNGNIPGGEDNTYSRNIIDNYSQLHRENPDKYPDTNWSDVILKSNAPRQTHSIIMSGGTEKLKTNASFAYDKREGLYEGREYERFTTKVNNNLTFNKYLAGHIDLNFRRSQSLTAVVDPMYSTRVAAPIYPAVWQDGRIANGKDGVNDYGVLKYGGNDRHWNHMLSGQIGLDISPLSGLKVSALFSPIFNFEKTKRFTKQVPWYTAEDPTVRGGYLSPAQGMALINELNENRNDNYSTTSQLLINYANTFGKHSIDLLAGFEEFYYFNEGLSAGRTQYLLTAFPYLDQGPLEGISNSGSAFENAYRSFFGRVMYNYRNKYLAQANLRYDASSRFDKKYRWGAFPSVSLGWVMSEEEFMQNCTVVSFLKLRGSWGNLGNERIGNYPYQSTVKIGNPVFLYEGNEVVSEQAAAQAILAVQDITWETTETYDLGLDVNFFNNRLRFSGDYYKKTTKGMLLELQIPMYMGFDNPNQNAGEMHTTGWEFELGWHDRVGDLSYSASFNLSDFRSIMGSLKGTEFMGDQVKFEGSEFNEWYGYRAVGIYQTQEQVNNSAKTGDNIQVGDLQYVDISGKDGIPDGNISPEYDKVLLGGSLPRFMYGGNISLAYKNIDFGIVFQGIGKQNARLTPFMIKPLWDNWGNAPVSIQGKYFSHYNTPEQNAAALYPRLSETTRDNNYAMSDHWIFNGAYFRLKNITLGYTIPEKISKKFQIQNLRIFSSLSDCMVISNYPKGWDPEGGDSTYPITMSVLFGLSAKF